jgi:hypothetical protein
MRPRTVACCACVNTTSSETSAARARGKLTAPFRENSPYEQLDGFLEQSETKLSNLLVVSRKQLALVTPRSVDQRNTLLIRLQCHLRVFRRGPSLPLVLSHLTRPTCEQHFRTVPDPGSQGA